MVSDSRAAEEKKKKMAVGMPTGQGAPFYDPFYRVNINRSSIDDNSLRYFDDFSVFNYLHLPKPQNLSISSPRTPSDIAHGEAKFGISGPGSHEVVEEAVPILSSPPKSATTPEDVNVPKRT